MIGKGAFKDIAAKTPGEFASAIGAAAVDQDDFIGDRFDGAKEASEIPLFVLGDDADAERNHFLSEGKATTPVRVSQMKQEQ